MTRDENPRHDGAPKRRKPQDRPPTSDTGPRLEGKPREAPSAQAHQRIAKLMARAGLCSRRDAEAWIVDGRVSVNGQVLTSPALDVGPQDVILVDGVPLPEPEMTRLFLFHKPRGLVTSDYDPEGRPTVADFLRDNWPDGPRVVTIGRLDINTEGLLLLTNDGGLARLLELPQTAWVRRYRVRAKGETDQGKLDALAAGVSIDGVDYIGIEAKLDRIQGANCWLTMGLREGKNREIKRVLEHIGLEVNRLIRLSFGPFQLLDLPEGAVEEVKTRVLRDQLGEALAAAAGVDFGDVTPSAVSLALPERGRRERPTGDGRPTKDAPPKRASSGDRPLRRDRAPRDTIDEAPPPIRERPQTGPRKHVSTLRTDARAATKAGPRKRIERLETADRNSRPVRVERLVTTQSKPETRSRRGADRPDARSDRPPRRDHASPSALGKRERMARSGGRDDAPRGRPDRAARPASSGPRKPRDAAERFDRADTQRGPAAAGPKRFDTKRPEGGERRERERPEGQREMREGAGRGAARARPGGERETTKPRSVPRERPDRDGERRGPASGGPKRFDTKRSESNDRRGLDRPEGSRSAGGPSRARPASDAGPSRGLKRSPGKKPFGNGPAAKRPPGKGAPRGPRGPATPKR